MREAGLAAVVHERLHRVLHHLERDQRLDGAARRLGATGRRLDTGRSGALLRGDPLGHPVHPALTDLPIGCWTSAAVLDLAGGRASRPAAQRLVALGVVTVLPTVASGLVDVSRREEPARRIGAVHAAANVLATTFYVWSWRDRRRGRHLRGVVLGGVGAVVATVGGVLGGHLAFGTTTDVAEPRPSDLTTTLPVG